jgi:hypothetical protein
MIEVPRRWLLAAGSNIVPLRLAKEAIADHANAPDVGSGASTDPTNTSFQMFNNALLVEARENASADMAG